MRGLRQSFRQELQWGTRGLGKRTVATCRELLAKERALWTFARIPEIHETNNLAERAHRHPVQWRKSSYGTASERGSRFGEAFWPSWPRVSNSSKMPLPISPRVVAPFSRTQLSQRGFHNPADQQFANSPSRERTPGYIQR